MSTPSPIAKHLLDIPVRSPHGNEMIRRDPRELPRRLRGLLLAINGQQTVGAYVHTLAGFGDVPALIDELMQLGLVELRSRSHYQIRPEAPPTLTTAVPSGAPPDLDLSDDESEFSSLFVDIEMTMDEGPQLESALSSPSHLMATLYDSTVRGRFDDLVRETQLSNPGYTAAPPPPPLTSETKATQIESLFALLEQVRTERQALKKRVQRLYKYRDRSKLLAQKNKRLFQTTAALALTCCALVTVLVVMVTGR